MLLLFYYYGTFGTLKNYLIIIVSLRLRSPKARMFAFVFARAVLCVTTTSAAAVNASFEMTSKRSAVAAVRTTAKRSRVTKVADAAESAEGCFFSRLERLHASFCCERLKLVRVSTRRRGRRGRRERHV
jgi:hypothetical protein